MVRPTLDLVQVGFFQPILDGMRDGGASTDHVIRQSGLHRFDLSAAENYVPSSSLYLLLDAICRREGLEDPAIELGNVMRVTDVPGIGDLVSFAPDVLGACRLVVACQHLVLTHEQCKFEVQGKKARLTSRLMDRPSVGKSSAESMLVSLMLAGFRVAAGNDWDPLEIHFQQDTPGRIDEILTSGTRTKILCGQKESALVFPTSMLTMPMMVPEPDSCLPNRQPSNPETLTEKISLILDSSLDDHLPGLSAVAEMTSCSSRTLQRLLGDEGMSYFDVVDRWRYIAAIQMVENSQTSIKDIAQRLRYANSSNFIRAFMRWTGETPHRYRGSLAS